MSQLFLPDQNILWEAVLSRDKNWDDTVVYGVKSTGIFCLPSCPSKRPARDSVVFFATNEEARAAGFRPCKRCQPDKAEDRKREFLWVMNLLYDPANEILTASQWAGEAGISLNALRRMTTARLGISPRDILNQRKMTDFRIAIINGDGVSESQYAAGYGSSSRLYEKASVHLGMTPGQYRNKGKNVNINYAIFDTKLGKALIAGTDRGICSLQFGDTSEELRNNLKREFAEAELLENPEVISGWANTLQAYLNGDEKRLAIPLDVHATVFRTKVWEAIRHIPYGETRSYSRLAEEIGKPSAARAVASACAANPVALVTPCHRVVHEDGTISSR
jgi:AraC family transcriptional regulator of adaptative response/methylated-DNA-[protein]-cysteine methyltransferase